MRRAFTLIELLVVLAIIAILLTFCLEVPAVSGPMRLAMYVVFGWIGVLWRLVTEPSIDVEKTATFLVCLVLLAVGTHLAGRWLYHRGQPESARRWSWRWTTSGLLIVLMAAGAGICAVAVTHQGVGSPGTELEFAL